MTTPPDPRELLAVYRDGLLQDTLPFWLRHAIDREHGGYLFCLARDGQVVDTDKGLWQHGRFAWLLATLCREVEPREEWLELSRHGLEFIERHGFDSDSRMLFQVTRDGRPLRKRRYVFSETFAAIAFGAYARAAGDDEAAERARELFATIIEYGTMPGRLPPKVDPTTRPMKSLAFPMILLATARELRETIGLEEADRWIEWSIDEIRRDFVKPDLRAVLETVGPRGELLDHFDGRLLNPGHAIEAAWFILAESRDRGGDRELRALALDILDWMWERGWDAEHGGLYYFRDVRDLPVTEYWHDMKFWWPHNEAIIATLLAWVETGEERHAVRHRLVHDWAHDRFADPEHGEWFGYLHRDGSVSSTLKGNIWKGPFHLPRMQLLCWKLLEGVGGEGA